eukprot:1741415-Rhodomonas_salina.2
MSPLASALSVVFPASFVAVVAVFSCVLYTNHRGTPPQVGLGALTDTSAVVWVLASSLPQSNRSKDCSGWDVNLRYRVVESVPSVEEQLRRVREPSEISTSGTGWSGAFKLQLQGRGDMKTCSQIVTLTGLRPSTAYEYVTTFKPGGSSLAMLYTSATASTTRQGSFQTTVEKGQQKPFTFVTSSCLLNIDMIDMQPLMSLMGADLFLLIGDAVYADFPWSFFRKYETIYLTLIRDPFFAMLSLHTPVLAMYDDHEICNNWNSGTKQPYPDAIGNWSWFLGSRNPPLKKPDDVETKEGITMGAVGGDWEQEHYFPHQVGDVSFFVLDVRRYRDGKTLLGPAQLAELRQWLREGGESAATEESTTERSGAQVRLKVVVSPVPMTRNIGEARRYPPLPHVTYWCDARC